MIGKFENALSEKQKDSVQEETLAVSGTEVIVHKKNNRAPNAQSQTDGRKPSCWSQRRKPFWKKRPKAVQKNLQMTVYGPFV